MRQRFGDRTLDAGYAVLAACAFFGFPIAALVPVLLSMQSRPVSVAYRALVLTVSLAFLWRAARMRLPGIPLPIRWALGLLAAMLLARLAWDSLGAALPLDLPWDDLWAQVLIFALVPALPFLYLPEHMGLILARTMCTAAGVIAVMAIGIGALYSLSNFTGTGRLATDVINPITIGEVGVSLFIVCLSARAVDSKEQRRRWSTMVRVAGGMLGAAACVLSASKGPLLSLVAVATLMFGYRLVRLRPGRRLAELTVASLLIGVVVALGALLAQHGLLAVYNRLSELTSDQSTAIRLQAWSGALAQFDASPLWGSAAVELSTRFYPHNSVLETMMATGVGGLVLVLLLQGWGALAAHRLLVATPQHSWIALLFVQHAIGGLVSGSVYLGGAYWISLLMLIGAYYAQTMAASILAPKLRAGAGI